MSNQSGAGTSKNLKWNFDIKTDNSEDNMTDDTEESTEPIETPIFLDTLQPNSCMHDKKEKFMQNIDRREPRHVCIVGGCDDKQKKSAQPKFEGNKNKCMLDDLAENPSNLATFITYICQHDCATNVTTQLKGDVNDPQKTILSDTPVNWTASDDLCVCSDTNSDATSLPNVVAPNAPPPYSAACAEQVQNNQPRYNEAPFNCGGQINLLMETQKDLKMRIDKMEERQKVGAALLQKADQMWSDMEKEYKQKIADSKKRQIDLNKKVKEIQESVNKWRGNFTDLDSQKSVLVKCRLDIREKKTQRKNDMKFIEAEITDLEKRKDQIQKDLQVLEGQIEPKKQHAEEEIQKMNKAIKELEVAKESEVAKREEKEKEGTEALKVARNELTNLTKVFMQKRMENQSLEATKADLTDEKTQLKASMSACKVTCSIKEKRLKHEIEQIEKEVEIVKSKTVKCTKCVDTKDMQSFCSDCPLCTAANGCEVKDGCCFSAGGGDNCICTDVKLRFIENVLENMYSVLVRQFGTKSGKDITESINNCLLNDTYGKLNPETREVLKDFIMDSLKKNMNMTLVAGAAKTRCELDPATYKRLMTCLNEIHITAPVKLDENTTTAKHPCGFWSGCNDCHCPKGPKECVCVTKLGKSPLVGCAIGKKHSPTNKSHNSHNCTDANVSNCTRYYTNTKAAQCLLEVDHQAIESTQLAKTSSHCDCADDSRRDPAEIVPCKSVGNCTWKSESTDSHSNNTKSYRNDKANDPFVWKIKKSDVVTYRDIVKVVVHGRNKVAVEIFADVIMTSSGDMALEINESVLVTTHMTDLKIVYLSLQIAPFGDYYIDISSARTANNKLKTGLLKTSADTALIFIPASMIDTIRGNDFKGDLSSSPSKELPKVDSSIVSLNEYTNSKSQIRSNLYLKHNEHLLAVLRKSGSHTFDVVLDKEHDGESHKKLTLLFSANKKCNITLKEHRSSISIRAEDSDDNVGSYIIQSPSGELKLICSSTTEILTGVETCALTYCDVPTEKNNTLPYQNDLRSFIDLSKPKIIKHSSIIEEMGLTNPLVIVPFSAKGTQISCHHNLKKQKHNDNANDIVNLFVHPDVVDLKHKPKNGPKNKNKLKCYCNRNQECYRLTAIRGDSLDRLSYHHKKNTEKFNKITINSNVALKRKPQEEEKAIEEIFPIKHFDTL